MSGTGIWADLLDYTRRETGGKEGSGCKEQKYLTLRSPPCFYRKQPSPPPGWHLDKRRPQQLQRLRQPRRPQQLCTTADRTKYGSYVGFDSPDSYGRYHSYADYNMHNSHGVHNGNDCDLLRLLGLRTNYSILLRASSTYHVSFLSFRRSCASLPIFTLSCFHNHPVPSIMH